MQRQAAAFHGLHQRFVVGHRLAHVRLEVQRHVVRPLGIGGAQVHRTLGQVQHALDKIARGRLPACVVRLVQDEHGVPRDAGDGAALCVLLVDLRIGQEHRIAALRQFAARQRLYA